MRQQQEGFTLIEMLVAMAIFTALISVLMLGFRQGLLMWEKGQQQSHVWLDYEFRYKLLDSLISQAEVADNECAPHTFSPYFIGNKHVMQFISAAPVMDVPGRVRFVMLEANRQGNGAWVLRYREGRDKSEGDWIVLLEGLQQLSFSFEVPARPLAGADTSWWSEEDKQLYRDKAAWLFDYDACKLRLFPQRLLMSFIDGNGGEHQWIFIPPQLASAWSMGAYGNDY